MPWYLRKSVRVGPVRFNFSKSGIGASVGVRGLRYGVRPDGRSYVHAGGYGIYYREELGPRGTRSGGTAPPAPPAYAEGPHDITHYQTTAARDLVPTSRQDLVAQLNESYKKPRLDLLLALLFGLAVIGGSLYVEKVLALGALVVGIFTTFRVARWEARRRTVAITYDLSDDEADRFRRLVNAFNQLASCQSVWARVSSRHLATTHEAKRHGGAWNLEDHSPAAVGEGKPPWVETNVSIPVLKARGQALYVLPDGILLYDATGVGFVEYRDIHLSTSRVRFVEGSPPRDADIVDHTWKHPNRDGTPDRRFKNNYQIPVCLYGELEIGSTSGLSLHLITSQSTATERFADQFRQVVKSP